MTERLRDTTRRDAEHVSRTEPPTAEEMENLLAAIGNNEAKALTLLGMSGGSILTMGDLHRLIMRLQGEQKGWPMNMKTPFNWCRHSLAPIGLVTRAVLDVHLNIFGYMITEYGQKIGVPLAGLLLEYSFNRPEVSLYRLFGSALSHSPHRKELPTPRGPIEHTKRSPGLRFRLFQLLAAHEQSMREREVADHLGETPFVVGEHLNNLQRFGMIEYASASPNVPSSFYKLAFGKYIPEKMPGEGWILRAIAQIFSQRPDEFLSNPDMTSAILERIPENANVSRQQMKYPQGKITNTLAMLHRLGYLERRQFDRFHRSEVSLSPAQRVVLRELCTILAAFQNGDQEVLERGWRFAWLAASTPTIATALFQKARKYSSMAETLSLEERNALIVSIVTSDPGCDVPFLRDRLEVETGRVYSETSINLFTRTLEQAGILVAERKGGKKLWSIFTPPTSRG